MNGGRLNCTSSAPAMIRRGTPERALAAVHTPDTSARENFDYLLIGAFIKRFERVDLEVEDIDGRIASLGLHGIKRSS